MYQQIFILCESEGIFLANFYIDIYNFKLMNFEYIVAVVSIIIDHVYVGCSVNSVSNVGYESCKILGKKQ